MAHTHVQTLSTYRLFNKSTNTGMQYHAPTGAIFDIYKSKHGDIVTQFFIVEAHHVKCSQDEHVIPLAKIQWSPSSGKIAVLTFQPQYWNLEITEEDLVLRLKPMLLEYL